MRQVLTWRFVAALGAVVGLALFVNAMFLGPDTVATVIGKESPMERRADLVSLVLETRQSEFGVRRDGTTRGRLTLALAPDRREITIYPETPGEVTCEQLDEFGQCAVLAGLLGDTILWFALVPMGPSFTFELPPIVSLDGGFATLVNGWRVPYATIIDRRCDSPAESFSEFLELVGRDHRSVYSLGERRITAVVC